MTRRALALLALFVFSWGYQIDGGADWVEVTAGFSIRF